MDSGVPHRDTVSLESASSRPSQPAAPATKGSTPRPPGRTAEGTANSTSRGSPDAAAWRSTTASVSTAIATAPTPSTASSTSPGRVGTGGASRSTSSRPSLTVVASRENVSLVGRTP